MKIVCDKDIPYIRGVLEPYGEVVYLEGSGIAAADVADADGVIVRTRTRCDEKLLGGSKVRFVGTATIGFDHIDTDYCHANGIEVATAAGSNAGGVLQWVASALALLSDMDGWNPAGKTLGVIGAGHIGSLVESYGKMWGFKVICSDPPREKAEGLGPDEGFVPLKELVMQADIITFHVPFTKTGEYPTHLMAGENFFQHIKDGAAIINSSRGGIVDECILGRGIKFRNCRAIIDTWENEPFVNHGLLTAVSAGTQHIAGYSAQGKANASAMMIEAIARYFSLPIKGWYPAEVTPFPERKPIAWEKMKSTVRDYCDLSAMTATLRTSPEDFEQLRADYVYRQEYF